MTKIVDDSDDGSGCNPDCLHCVVGEKIQEFINDHNGELTDQDICMIGQVMCDMVAIIEDDKKMIQVARKVRSIVNMMLDDVITGGWCGDEDDVGETQGSA